MEPSVKYLTRSAISSAAGFLLLYLTSILPSGKLGMLCVSGFAVVFVMMSCHWKWALGSYAVTAILGIILLPDKALSLSYALFCGWYPVAKLLLERLTKPLHRWVGKFAAFNVVFIPALLLGKELFLSGTSWPAISPIWIWLAANLCFLVYDYACKYVILFYIRNIARRMK